MIHVTSIPTRYTVKIEYMHASLRLFMESPWYYQAPQDVILWYRTPVDLNLKVQSLESGIVFTDFVDDVFPEGDEQFLSAAPARCSSSLLPPAFASLTILNDDHSHPQAPPGPSPTYYQVVAA